MKMIIVLATNILCTLYHSDREKEKSRCCKAKVTCSLVECQKERDKITEGARLAGSLKINL